MATPRFARFGERIERTEDEREQSSTPRFAEMGEPVDAPMTDRERRGQQFAQTYQNLLRDVGGRLFPDASVAELAIGAPIRALGLQDEAVGLGAMAVGGDFSTARQAEAERIDQLRSDMPVSSLLAEGVGAIGAGLLAAPAILARAPAGIQSMAASRPMLSGGALGGATGGAVGAAEGEGVGGRVVGGLLGAGLGAPLGAAAAPVASRISGAISGAAENVPAGIRRLFGQRDAAAAAAPTPDGAFFGERLGPQGESLITSIAQRPDQAGRAVQEAARGRAAERTERVMAEVTQRTGGQRGVDILMDGRAARQQAAPLFEAAGAQSVPISGAIRARLRELNRLGVSFDVADRTIERGGVRLSALIDDTLPEGGAVPVRALHQLVQDVEDAAGSAFRDGRGNVGRALANEARDLRRSLKDASPEFREASAIYAGQARDNRAFELGQSAFQQGRSRARTELELNDFLGNVSDMAASERGAFMAGVLDAIENATAGTAAGGNPASRLTRKGIEERLSIILGRDTARDLARTLVRQNQLADLDRLYQPTLGSQTAARQSAQGAENRLAAGALRGGTADAIDTVGEFLSAPVTATRRAASGAVRGRMSEEEAMQLAEILMSQGDPTQNLAMQRFLQSIKQEGVRRQGAVVPAGLLAGSMAGN
jgi:hypothetical protein